MAHGLHCPTTKSPEWPAKVAKSLQSIWKFHKVGYLTVVTLNRKSCAWGEFWFKAGVGKQSVYKSKGTSVRDGDALYLFLSL
ncbi:hypothetical protein [Sulfitobacter sp. MF3-043]|uniref:hypothetical protein n=1 Tax=Sulfitobacter sediminivivens TaxID=3252902 RepID=UPI0036DBF228